MESESGKLDVTMEDLVERMEHLEIRLAGKEKDTPTPTKTPFAPVSTTAKKIAEMSDGSFLKSKASTATKLPVLQPVVFTGVDLDDFIDDFSRWLRLSGLNAE